MADICYGCMKMKECTPVCEHCGYDNRNKNGIGQLQTGTILQGKYLVGRALEPCFGYQPYMGLDLLIQEPVWIRMYDLQSAPDAFRKQIRNRLLWELQCMDRLHEIPEIHGIDDWLVQDGQIYAIEKCPNGDSLRKLVSSKNVPADPSEFLLLLRPIMEALSKMHRSGLIHGDISPEHILMDQDHKMTIIGASFLGDGNPKVDRNECIPLESSFHPIEMMTTKGMVGPWTDVYALCATVYYCLSGKKPVFCGDRIMEGWEPNWHAFRGLSYQQCRALTRGMEVRPENRIQSMEQLMDELFGTSFVHVDPFTDPGPEPLGGVPVHRPLGGAKIFDPDPKPDGPKKWLGKLFKKE